MPININTVVPSGSNRRSEYVSIQQSLHAMVSCVVTNFVDTRLRREPNMEESDKEDDWGLSSRQHREHNSKRNLFSPLLCLATQMMPTFRLLFTVARAEFSSHLTTVFPTLYFVCVLPPSASCLRSKCVLKWTLGPPTHVHNTPLPIRRKTPSFSALLAYVTQGQVVSVTLIEKPALRGPDYCYYLTVLNAVS